MGRLISCRHCGGFHRIGEECNKQKERQANKEHRVTRQREIRNTNAWKKKSKAIKQRDNYLCQACLHNYEGTLIKHNAKEIEVHHIVPLIEDDTLAFDSENLISLCIFHHKLADHEGIPRHTLRSWIPPRGRY